MDKLEELKRKYEELGKEIERLKRGNVGRWKLEENEKYWYIDSFGGATDVCWADDNKDNWRYINNNVFKTGKEAEEYRDYILARAEYVKEFTTEEWKNGNLAKWAIYYDYELKQLSTDYLIDVKNIGTLTFESERKAEDFIDKYEKLILKYEFGVEV